jgi:hypothetical protein
LLVVVTLLVVAVAHRSRRDVWASAALGVGTHLFSDLGTGTVVLWWPVAADPVAVPYSAYTLLTGVLVALAALTAFVRLQPAARGRAAHGGRRTSERPSAAVDA